MRRISSWRALLAGVAVIAPGVVLTLALLLAPAHAAAQSGFRISVDEENVRAEPNGARVAVVQRGFVFLGGEARGQWRGVTLEGWVPSRSVIANSRDGYDLIVAGAGGALHLDPAQPPQGRLMGGVQLREIAREGNFVRVQRPAWVWQPSLASAPAPAPYKPPAPQPAAPAASSETAAAPSTAEAPAQTPTPSGARALLRTPAGDTVAALLSDTEMEIVGRQGEWARVRLEGWVRADGDTLGTTATGPRRGISLRALRSEPDRYLGTVLEWQVQFMAVQRADSLRSDFEVGEPFILARDPGGEPGFVYIAVPPEMLASVRQIPPLRRIEVVARVRAGRSALTGHPVLDLIELREVRR